MYYIEWLYCELIKVKEDEWCLVFFKAIEIILRTEQNIFSIAVKDLTRAWFEVLTKQNRSLWICVYDVRRWRSWTRHNMYRQDGHHSPLMGKILFLLLVMLRMEPRSSYLPGMYYTTEEKSQKEWTVRREKEEKLEAWSRKSREWKEQIMNGELLSPLRAGSGDGHKGHSKAH